MTDTVNQPSAMPTRKLTGALIAASIAAFVEATVTDLWPHLANPIIWEPLPIIAAGVVGYFIKDRPNVDPLEADPHYYRGM